MPMIREDELDALIGELSHSFGYDFAGYVRTSLIRRVNRLLITERLPGLAELLMKIKAEPGFLTKVVESLTVNVTEMFRDPATFSVIREKVLPVLATHPFIRVWHAGCSSGEEVYSMAVLLQEAGLLDRSLLYATDLNPSVVENLRNGVFPLSRIRQFSENYLLSGGRNDFSSYYTTRYGWAKFHSALAARMVAATHNLVSDRSFNVFQLIFCRNVLIYFNRELQDKVLTLFDNSLDKGGFLVLGSKEHLQFSTVADRYAPLQKGEKIWCKVKQN